MRRCSEIFCRLLEYCWISRNLDQVSECVEAGNVSDIIPHALFLSHFNPSLAECEPSWPALCDDVTFFSPQGGCWGLKSPAGHPWHPSFPPLFVPWWGNRHLGGWWMRPVAWNQALHPNPFSAPSPLFSIRSALANSPLLLLLPADSMISPSPFTSHHRARTCTLTHYQSTPHPLSRLHESAPQWNFKRSESMIFIFHI